MEKKKYQITINLSEENLKQGSKVYHAANISKPLEVSDTHSPSGKESIQIQPTVISNVCEHRFNTSMLHTNQNVVTPLQDKKEKEIVSNTSSPPTEKSTNRTRARIQVETLDSKFQTSVKQPKF